MSLSTGSRWCEWACVGIVYILALPTGACTKATPKPYCFVLSDTPTLGSLLGCVRKQGKSPREIRQSGHESHDSASRILAPISYYWKCYGFLILWRLSGCQRYLHTWLGARILCIIILER